MSKIGDFVIWGDEAGLEMPPEGSESLYKAFLASKSITHPPTHPEGP